MLVLIALNLFYYDTSVAKDLIALLLLFLLFFFLNFNYFVFHLDKRQNLHS